MDELTFENIHQYALKARKLGFSVIPPKQNGTKAPIDYWKNFTKTLPTEDQINSWYAAGRTGVGFVCGRISGNLEVLDFDDRGIWFEYERLAKETGMSELLNKVKHGYMEYTPNGVHLLYRCSDVSGALKLSYRITEQSRKTLIETKGEGGFIIVAPTYGAVNKNGSYVLQSGGLENIAEITPDERQALHNLAKSMGSQETKQAPVIDSTMLEPDGDRPGDIFNNKASWDDVLLPHGWRRTYSDLSGKTYWTRPGKQTGVSATTNYHDYDLLYVFTTSTQFESNRGYSKFTAYALLNHDGDFELAADDLRQQGYKKDEPENKDVDLSFLLKNIKSGQSKVEKLNEEKFNLSKYKNYQPKPHYKFPNYLLDIPGVLGQLTHWITRTNPRYGQRVLSLGAAISAMATVLGRKVKTELSQKPNLYILGVAATGGGKSRPRQAIKDIFEAIDRPDMANVSRISSDAALEECLRRSPSMCFNLDEAGFLLQDLNNKNTPSHLRRIKDFLLQIHSEKDFEHTRKMSNMKNGHGKDIETPPPILDPNLVVFGVSTPDAVYPGLSCDDIRTGFAGRFSVFESENNYEIINKHYLDNSDIPGDVFYFFKWWAEAPTCLGNPLSAGNLSETNVCRPEPLIVKFSGGAKQMLLDFDRAVQGIRKDLNDQQRPEGVYSRTVEIAQKFALIRSCGINIHNPEITIEDVNWGLNLSIYLTNRFRNHIEKNVTNKEESRLKALIEYIKDNPKIRHSDLMKKFNSFRKQFNDYIKVLIEYECILAIKESAGVGKKPATHYIFNKDFYKDEDFS